MSVKINYGNIAIGAKDDFVPVATDKAAFINLSQLKKSGIVFENYGNPCELYQVVLDGSQKPLPNNAEQANLGLWSEQITDSNGDFATPILLTLTAQSTYTSSGITLTFDTYNNIFADHVKITWKKDSAVIAEQDFYPDSAAYFCNKKVDEYNKVEVVFYHLNMPLNRLKLHAIDYGEIVTFSGNELRGAKIIQELDAISSNISINTCEFTLDAKEDREYEFQERQPVQVFFDDKLRSTTFVKSARRKSKITWDIQTEDYIGILDTTTFYGGIYSEENAGNLFEEILKTANVPYNITPEFYSKTVTGYIPFTTCREALMQVAFAAGAAVDTSNSDKVNVFELSDEIAANVPLEKILQGQSFDEETKVTAIEVTAHKYALIVDGATEEDIKTIEVGEIGNNILVKFSEPMIPFSVENGDRLEYSANHVIINARSGCKIIGLKYRELQTIHRLDMPNPSSVENIISVQNATLVSDSNVDNILQRCYNYYRTNRDINLKIVENKKSDISTVVGDKITCQTEYLGEMIGRITRQSYNLNGNIIIKDTVMREL